MQVREDETHIAHICSIPKQCGWVLELLDANAICALRLVDNKYAKNCEVRNFCALRKNLHTLLFSSFAFHSLQKREEKGLRTAQKFACEAR